MATVRGELRNGRGWIARGMPGENEVHRQTIDGDSRLHIAPEVPRQLAAE